MKTQRNAPCPCGSGKKYKRCCGQLREAASPITQAVADAIQQEADTQNISSIEALNRIATTVSGRQNQQGLDDFLGLSPDQMSGLLYQPFDSPSVVRFSTASVPAAPILRIYNALVSDFGDNGVKATAKKNLPLKLCQAIFATDNYDNPLGKRPQIYTEIEFDALHTTRLTAEAAKLIALRKGRFVLTKKGKSFSSPNKQGELYFELFKAYATQFNWGYRDNMEDADIIQHGFLFTLYILACCGEHSRSADFYTDHFIRAFPMVVNAFEGSQYSSVEEDVKHCFILRSLEHFSEFFGLIELTKVPGDWRNEKMTIKKTASLAAFITFHG